MIRSAQKFTVRVFVPERFLTFKVQLPLGLLFINEFNVCCGGISNGNDVFKLDVLPPIALCKRIELPAVAGGISVTIKSACLPTIISTVTATETILPVLIEFKTNEPVDKEPTIVGAKDAFNVEVVVGIVKLLTLIFIDQLFMKPDWPDIKSYTIKFQTPLMLLFTNTLKGSIGCRRVGNMVIKLVPVV